MEVYSTAFAIIAAGLLVSLVLIATRLRAFARPRRQQKCATDRPPPPPTGPVFLFDADFLIDASSSAQTLIGHRPAGMTEYDAVFHALARPFPTLRQEVETLKTGQSRQLVSTSGSALAITIADQAGLLRLSLQTRADLDCDAHFAMLEKAAQAEELGLLRNLVDNAPQLVWQEDHQGNVIWANRAYLELSDSNSALPEGARQFWPGQRLFTDIQNPGPSALEPVKSRHALRLRDRDAECWFDITSVPMAGAVMHYATDSNEVVRAEQAKRAFHQTLAKTFAQLSIGLAIFDRKRELTMFNPAILDMTGLPFAFLSARPSIDMVLDQMRELRRLPEPKDYSSWRERFKALEAEAEDGTYCETWDLPDGQTYRVTGRPHPDGALAFLFEDISAEIMLTRRFRTEIETGQAVLDTLGDALAVFSPARTLVMTNLAYQTLWGTAEDSLSDNIDLRAALRVWRAATIPTDLWDRVERFTAEGSDRSAWSGDIVLTDGRTGKLHATPISGGMTMIRFALATVDRSRFAAVSARKKLPEAVRG